MKFIEVPLINDDGKSVFPERFSDKDIDKLKKAHGSYWFSAEYMMSPIAPEDQIFDSNWLQYYYAFRKPKDIHNYPKDSAFLPEELVCLVTIDPASRRKKTSDYTAGMIHGFDAEGNWYVVYAMRDKLSPSQRINMVFELVRHATRISQKPVKVIYETIGFQDTDKQWLLMEQKKRDIYFNVEEIKSHKSSKVDRIKALQPLFEAGKIWWPKKCTYTSIYEKRRVDIAEAMRLEYDTFPKGVHDDLLDAHSFPMYMDNFKHIRAAEKVKVENVMPEFCMARIKENRLKRDMALYDYVGW